MKLNSTTSLIIIGLVVVAGGYWYFSSGQKEEPALTTTTSAENQAQTRFQTLVSTLKPISFDTALFTDPRFLRLVDLATPITSEPVGHLDPFAQEK